jgi:hypothetical protein
MPGMTGGPARDAPTVYLHVGPPKSGTTYIQETLRQRYRELRNAGVLCPEIHTRDEFAAAMDVRGRYGFGADDDSPRKAVGAWGRLVRIVRAASGTVVVSHELFATADGEHAARAVADLADTDLHIIVTARDPARQIVSAWQQRVKQGSDHPFASVERRLLGHENVRGAQDLIGVLDRWASSLAPDHVHVVTVPPPGSDPRLLWARFAAVIGVAPDEIEPPDVLRTNEALGIAETELMRRVNAALGGRIPHPRFGRVVTRGFVREILAAQSGSPKAVLPDTVVPAVDKLAESWISVITERGYDVSGDLADLRPRRRTGRGPADASDREVADAAVAAIAGLLVRVAERASDGRSLRQRVASGVRSALRLTSRARHRR